MKLIHGTWIPDSNSSSVVKGSFCIWIETTETRHDNKDTEHTGSLNKEKLIEFLAEIKAANLKNYSFSKKYFILPTSENKPVLSYELVPFTESEAPENFEFQKFSIDCCVIPLQYLSAFLNELHFYCLYNSEQFMPGADILFWYHYIAAFKEIIFQDQYIPFLKCIATDKSKTKLQVLPFWQIISTKYSEIVKRYTEYMPALCVSGTSDNKLKTDVYLADTLLKHFSENLLKSVIEETKFTDKVIKLFSGTFIEAFLNTSEGNSFKSFTASQLMDLYKKWFIWKERIVRSDTGSLFNFCFKLENPKEGQTLWTLTFLAESKKDPSLKITLDDYWSFDEKKKKQVQKTFGKDLEKNIILDLGYAAKIYPLIWSAMNNDKPSGLNITVNDAFEFLKEKALILESSGFKIILPSWWTPAGRKRAKIKLKASSVKSSSASAGSKKLFSADSLVNYQYKLAIGEIELSEKEWRDLVNSKVPLVNFRGEWVELDPEKMMEILQLWQKAQKEPQEMSVSDLIKMASREDEFQIDYDKNLQEMMAKFRDKSKFELVKEPDKLKGSLREYQKRGVSWIEYLESLGLNGCLADDMGLGKTIQVIGRLLREREGKASKLQPTLLIAPTSVVGNWQHEFDKFAPDLKILLHHGSKRIKDEAEFIKISAKNDIIITSYSLVKRDEAFFKAINWERIVIDEAQNIKNPKSEQSKTLLKLTSRHKIALTGTPVENRLLDLWSIFNFLNPGYLGNQSSFRKNFEIPVQKENNLIQAKTLKNLVEPFILRRLKTDKNIIKDLPDKVEQKIYCNLTKEQGSLYEAVVKEISEEVDNAEGIKRKGLILSSLMRLKQICNHPAQFLHDNSEFSITRSHKLSRLADMVAEIIESGESLLIFSQFREVCEELDKLIRKNYHYRTYLLHGETGRTKRQKMIEEFQNPDSIPSVFILSLKAGGVGINLTRANHVIHFDRWWNPAVEEQATDRAFRIGQSKNVFVHKFVSIGTLEEKIDQLLEDKKKFSGAILTSDESWLSELDNDAFKKLIRLSKDAVLAE